MEAILFSFYTLLLLAVLYKWKFFSEIPLGYKISLFLLKVAAGIAAGIVYTKYLQGGDTHTFMKDAVFLFSTLSDSPAVFLQLVTGIGDPALIHYYYSKLGTSVETYGQWFNNSVLFLRLNTLLCILSRGYYSIHVLFMCFFSFIGLVAIYKTINTDKEKFSPFIFIIPVLLPCSLFWGSMMLKEPVAIFFLGLTLFYLHKVASDIQPKHIASFILFFLALIVFKSHVALSLIPGLIAWMIYMKMTRSWLKIFTATFILFMIAAVILSKIDDSLNIFLALHNQQIIFMKFAVYYKANSLIELIPFSPDAISVYKRTPEALLTALLRPYPGEADNMLQYFSVMENVVTLLLIAFLVMRMDKQRIKNNPVVLLMISSGIIVLAITAFTTPVLGALVRLKMPGIILLIGGLLVSFRQKGHRVV